MTAATRREWFDNAAREDMEAANALALARVCPECSAQVGVACLNAATGREYCKPIEHMKRMRETD